MGDPGELCVVQTADANANARHLAKFNSQMDHRRDTWAVDHPDDVFDTFDRLIGDVIVTASGKELNANLWLCEHGWAFPTFYSSMSRQEIAHLTPLR